MSSWSSVKYPGVKVLPLGQVQEVGLLPEPQGFLKTLRCFHLHKLSDLRVRIEQLLVNLCKSLGRDDSRKAEDEKKLKME